MHDNHTLLESRARRVLVERIQPQASVPVADLRVEYWQVTDDPARPGQGEPVPFEQAVSADYRPFAIGSDWGPAWGTTWFRISGTVPVDEARVASGDQSSSGNSETSGVSEHAAGAHETATAGTNASAGAHASVGLVNSYEAHIDLGWEDHSPGFQAEGLVYRPDGTIVKALNPRNTWIPLDGPGDFTFYIEAAANPLLLGVPPFQPSDLGDKLTSPATPIYRFKAAQLVVVNQAVRELACDLNVLSETALTMPDQDQARLRLTAGINQALNLLDLDDVPGTAPAVRDALAPLLAKTALPGAHQVTAVGHAHIDTAWLWPLRETRRKVVRTLANVLRLLDDGADMVFALPAAQHVAWLEEDAPQIFARVQDWVKRGRIVPVGGMWVEPDAMLPGGEALSRQLIEGQKYFQRAFGVTCDGVWLPDSFGYSAALPQIAALGGARWFLTQKISWNQTDVFPHHTLLWEGIDGTRLFTHFPPADTYGSEVTPAQLHYSAQNFKDRAHANQSLLLFGYGDGGGGPTREMVWRMERMQNLQGLPTISVDTPDAFFKRALAESAGEGAAASAVETKAGSSAENWAGSLAGAHLPVWVGELYLELHRGTLTSQAGVKLGNRQAQAALHQAEMWAATAAIRAGFDYPYEELQELWQTTLLLQFHDILPGSSIAWVYRDQAQMHADVIRRANQVTAGACAALSSGVGQVVSFNSAPVENRGIAPFSAGVELTEVPEVSCEQTPDGWKLSNGRITATVGENGAVTSLVRGEVTGAGRETVPPGQELGQLWLYQDFPNMWDAWDVDQFYLESGRWLVADRVEADGEQVRAHFVFGRSKAQVTWSFPAEAEALQVKVDVDWQESEKLLKLQLPLDVHTDHAQYETQMGYVTRPIHENTSWDVNRFEVAAHRWVHVGENGWGVGVVNQATYGWSHQRSSRPGGGTFVTLGASLLRASKFPDPHQDQGQHSRSFWLVPGADIAATQRAAYQMDLPLWQVEAGADALNSAALTPLVKVDGFIVETIKLAEDHSGDLIVRGFEASGTRRDVSVTFGRPVSGVRAVNLLEIEAHGLPQVKVEGQSARFQLGAFQIVTLRVQVA